MKLYIIYDEISKKNWMFIEAATEREAVRQMRQAIIKYQKDIDFDFSLREFDDLPNTEILPVVKNSDELFKDKEVPEEEKEV